MNVTRSAHAKLTLSLHITATRDDGYHELEALTVALAEPHDTISVRRATATSIAVTGPFAPGVPTDSSNLVARAAAMLGVEATIDVVKEIPHGAGLGGGSADAATTLLALRELYGLGTSDTELRSIAARLGADVAFCLGPEPVAWMRGVGDVIEPASVPPCWFVVATPPFACSTPAVYRAWDALGGPAGERVEFTAGFGDLANDLEPAAWHVEPRLRAFRDGFAAATNRPVILAGSGSSYVALCETTDEARAAFGGVATAGLDTRGCWISTVVALPD